MYAFVPVYTFFHIFRFTGARRVHNVFIQHSTRYRHGKFAPNYRNAQRSDQLMCCCDGCAAVFLQMRPQCCCFYWPPRRSPTHYELGEPGEVLTTNARTLKTPHTMSSTHASHMREKTGATADLGAGGFHSQQVHYVAHMCVMRVCVCVCVYMRRSGCRRALIFGTHSRARAACMPLRVLCTQF